MGISYELLDANSGVPYPGSFVLRSRGDSSAIRGPRHAVDRLSVCADDDDLDTGFGVPYPYRSVLRSGNEPPTIRRPCHVSNLVIVAVQHREFGAAL